MSLKKKYFKNNFYFSFIVIGFHLKTFFSFIVIDFIYNCIIAKQLVEQLLKNYYKYLKEL